MEKLSELKRKYKNIFVYGNGNYANRLIKYWGKEIQYITCFFVSKYSDNPYKSKGIEVKEFDSYKGELEDSVIIFAINEQLARKIYAEKVSSRISSRNVIFVSEDFMKIVDEKNSNDEVIDYYHRLVSDKLLFNYIEIETINRCNGVCEFCPVNANATVQRQYAKMETPLFEAIIEQLQELNYKGEVALFSNNEPFLDNRIVEFAKYARRKLQDAYIYLYTNGSLLDVEKYAEIMKYLDKMQIDLYILEGEDEPKNIKEIRMFATQSGYDKKTVFFSISPNAVRYSRAGNSPNGKVNYKTNELCRLPLTQMVVRPDGKVSLCCNDALGQMTLGDLTKDTIKDVWFSDARKRIWEKNIAGRQEIELCKFCNSIDRRELSFPDESKLRK